jgi:hypothetical protein
MEDYLKDVLQKNVYANCSTCTLPCVFGDWQHCTTYRDFVLCFKCGKRRDVVHSNHDTMSIKGAGFREKRELSVLKRVGVFQGHQRMKYRRELGLE